LSSTFRRLSAELPLVVGIALGWLGCWWMGAAFVLDGTMHGYGWTDYVNNAWMIWHGEQLGYNNFREPLHAWMLAGLGESMGSYANAAIVLSSVAAFALCLGAGFLARGLAGPWAGGLAAAATPWTSHGADLANWANNYGVGAGAVGLFLGLSGLCFLAPRAWVMALAGVAGGVAWGLDLRLMALAPAAALLVLLGLTRADVSWRTRLGGLVLFCAGLAVGPWSHDALWLEVVADPTWPERVAFQKKVIARWASHHAELRDVCQGWFEGDSLILARSACGDALQTYNLDKVLPHHLPFGGLLTLLGLALGLLPGKAGWRGSLGGLALIGAMASLALLARTMPIPDRYVVTYAVVAAACAPVGLARLVATPLPARFASWGVAAAVLGLGLWAWFTDPSERSESTELSRSPRILSEREFAEVVVASIGPDDLYRDCSKAMITSTLLPRLTQPYPPMLRMEGRDQCLSWIQTAPPETGRRWASINRNDRVPDFAGQAIDGSNKIDLEAEMQYAGWEQIEVRGNFQLWRQPTTDGSRR